METKDELIKTIREWVKIDNEIRALQKEQLIRKNKKKDISSVLIDIMKKNEIDCFDINDGQIIYNKKNVKKPITKKILLEVLEKYYKDDILKANDVNNFILNNREEKIQEEIIRKIRGNLCS
jgi:DNA-binding protein Fis